MTELRMVTEQDVELSENERVRWEALRERHADDLRWAAMRSLFDDVRPEWEAHFAEQERTGA
jgi:hypothetical protein